MNRFRKAWSRAVSGLKNAVLRWGGGAYSWWDSRLGRTTVNYAAEVGDGSGNAAVQACLKWMGRTFLEAPPRLQRYQRDEKLAPEPRHALTRLLRRPNPHYTGRALWKATINDRKVDGNAYWYKLRSRAGLVVELWWLPTWMVQPMRREGSGELVTHYEYVVEGRRYELRREDVVHFRGDPDPRNPMKGLGEIRSLLREIFTDDEAANYTASLLRNMGVTGPIIRPKTPEDVLTREQADAIKGQFQANFTGDNRGMPLVGLVPMDVDQVGYNPEQMQLRELRRLPEERIAAVLGVPPILAGLGAGLERATYANYAEAREAGFEGAILPMQGDFAEEIMLQLVPDFDDPEAVEFDFDISGVRVLQEDEDSLATRLATLVGGGIITVDEARQEVGDQPLPGGVGDVLLIPSKVMVTKVADLGKPPEPLEEPTPLPAGGREPGAMAAD
jgi:HK97 family phage portal protein